MNAVREALPIALQEAYKIAENHVDTVVRHRITIEPRKFGRPHFEIWYSTGPEHIERVPEFFSLSDEEYQTYRQWEAEAREARRQARLANSTSSN